MKIVHINKEKIIAEQEVKDFVKKLRERQAKRAYKMLFQEQAKKTKTK